MLPGHTCYKSRSWVSLAPEPKDGLWGNWPCGPGKWDPLTGSQEQESPAWGLETRGEKAEEGGKGNSQITGFVTEVRLDLHIDGGQGDRQKGAQGARGGTRQEESMPYMPSPP